MDVTYKTTVDDYLVYCRHHFKSSKACFQNYLVGWLLLPLGLLIAALYGFFQADWDTIFVQFLVLGAGAHLVFYPLMYRLWFDSYVRNYATEHGTKGVIGNLRLILNEDTLVEITETTKSEADWKDIHRIDEVGGYTFIYVTPLAAAILPKHAFASEEEYERTRDYAKDCLSSKKA